MQSFEGVIDVHAHADPDKTARSLDVLELAKMYRDRGFRAVVLMNHYDATVGMAYLVDKYTPGLDVYGGLVLNRMVGGINPVAVEHMQRVEGGRGKIVYMPTIDSENEVRRNESGAPFVRISKDGQLLPEVLDMLDLIASTDLALSTGHSSPEEILLLVREARKRGIERILVTNPLYWAITMSVEQMVEAGRLGAYLEFIYYSVGRPGASVTMRDYAEAIKAIGPEQCILSSCGGQAWLPVHTFAWVELFRGLHEHGISEEDLALMSKRNPARLLGLDQREQCCRSRFQRDDVLECAGL
jgi:hypothetical protein